MVEEEEEREKKQEQERMEQKALLNLIKGLALLLLSCNMAREMGPCSDVNNNCKGEI